MTTKNSPEGDPTMSSTDAFVNSGPLSIDKPEQHRLAWHDVHEQPSEDGTMTQTVSVDLERLVDGEWTPIDDVDLTYVDGEGVTVNGETNPSWNLEDIEPYQAAEQHLTEKYGLDASQVKTVTPW